MGKVYSQDFRLRVLSAIDKGQSKLSIHRTLGVSRTTIDDWLLLREQTGAVVPKASPASPRRAIRDLVAFETFAASHQDSTLAQMAADWQKETGRKLSINTFSLTLKRIGWTRKKRVVSTANAMPPNAPTSRPT